MSALRNAAVAGAFYPGSPYALQESLQDFLQAAPEPPQGLPKAIIVPHAGYRYSGPIAAAAYRSLATGKETIQRVVMLGPAHRHAVCGLALPQAMTFVTPLGQVAVDEPTYAAVRRLPQVDISEAAHALEHALEVQLPFLQAVLKEFTLLPLVAGDTHAQAVAEVLETVWGGDETLIIISSDLSHYLPYTMALRRDAATIKQILGLHGVLDYDDACGAMPINGLLLAAKAHGLRPTLLDLRNSADTAGEPDRVVGYAALAFYKDSPDAH